jgi:putative transposase
MDRTGRWHVAFAAIPAPVPAPGNGQVVGVDRGVAVSAALSSGELLRVPGLTGPEHRRLRRLERKLARARHGSTRRKRVRLAIARLKARETDRRKDWAEKTSTDLARRFDLIRVEKLNITCPACEPRTSTAALADVVVGIPAPLGRGGCQSSKRPPRYLARKRSAAA